MNKDIYEVLKKAIASGALSPIDLSIAEYACDKYERDLKADREEREWKKQQMIKLVFELLNEAGRPITPTEMQFMAFKKYGYEYANGKFTWYCMQLYLDHKLKRRPRGNKVYYSIREKE